MFKIAISVAGGLILSSAGQAAATHGLAVGQCVTSKIAAADVGKGSISITYENGIKQILNRPSAGMKVVTAGEPVALCVGRLGSPCAQGATKGAVYHAKSLKSGDDWLSPDLSGKCGL